MERKYAESKEKFVQRKGNSRVWDFIILFCFLPRRFETKFKHYNYFDETKLLFVFVCFVIVGRVKSHDVMTVDDLNYDVVDLWTKRTFPKMGEIIQV